MPARLTVYLFGVDRGVADGPLFGPALAQEIDIELPTASYPTDDPAHVNFDNMRFTTITALPYVQRAVTRLHSMSVP